MFALTSIILAAALTLPVQWTVPVHCPTELMIDAPAYVVAGDKLLLSFSADEPAVFSYGAVVGEEQLATNKASKGNVTIDTLKRWTGKELRIDAQASAAGCEAVTGQRIITIAGTAPKNASKAAQLSLPEPVLLVPYIVAGIAVVIAGILIWRRG